MITDMRAPATMITGLTRPAGARIVPGSTAHNIAGPLPRTISSWVERARSREVSRLTYGALAPAPVTLDTQSDRRV